MQSFDHFTNSVSLRTILLITLLVLFVVGLVVALIAYWPDGVDYYYTFYPSARIWLDGKSLLYDNPANRGYYHPPWTMFYLALFALWPFRTGQAFLWIASVAMIAYCSWTFAPSGRLRPWALAFAIFNFHTFDHLFRGEIASLEVMGLALGWRALRGQQPLMLALAYVALMSIPPNSVPIVLFFLWQSWRQWGKRDIAMSLAPPLFVFLLSFVVFPGWPARWFDNYIHLSPTTGAGWWLTTLWRAASQLSLPSAVAWAAVVITLGVTIWVWGHAAQQPHPTAALYQLMLVVSATMVITPFSLGYRLVTLVAMAIPLILGWDVRAGVGLYVLTFLPMARLVVGVENSWIDIIFVIAVFVAVVAHILTARPANSETPQNQPVNGE